MMRNIRGTFLLESVSEISESEAVLMLSGKQGRINAVNNSNVTNEELLGLCGSMVRITGRTEDEGETIVNTIVRHVEEGEDAVSSTEEAEDAEKVSKTDEVHETVSKQQEPEETNKEVKVEEKAVAEAETKADETKTETESSAESKDITENETAAEKESENEIDADPDEDEEIDECYDLFSLFGIPDQGKVKKETTKGKSKVKRQTKSKKTTSKETETSNDDDDFYGYKSMLSDERKKLVAKAGRTDMLHKQKSVLLDGLDAGKELYALLSTVRWYNRVTSMINGDPVIDTEMFYTAIFILILGNINTEYSESVYGAGVISVMNLKELNRAGYVPLNEEDTLSGMILVMAGQKKAVSREEVVAEKIVNIAREEVS